MMQTRTMTNFVLGSEKNLRKAGNPYVNVRAMAVSLFFLCVMALMSVLVPNFVEPVQAEGSLIVDPDHPQWFKHEGGNSFFLCGPGDPEDFLYRGTLNPNGTRNGDQLTLINKLVANWLTGVISIKERDQLAVAVVNMNNPIPPKGPLQY